MKIERKGLSYFPFETGFFEDLRIIELSEKYGPIGVCVYLATLCTVYREGYYIEMSEQRLSQIISRMIGVKWLARQGIIGEIIRFCGETGLLERAMLARGYITSRGIQKRYSIVHARDGVDRSECWLLDKKEP